MVGIEGKDGMIGKLGMDLIDFVIGKFKIVGDLIMEFGKMGILGDEGNLINMGFVCFLWLLFGVLDDFVNLEVMFMNFIDM